MTPDQSAITDEDLSGLLSEAASAGDTKDEAPPTADPPADDGSVALEAILNEVGLGDGDAQASATEPESEETPPPSVQKAEPDTDAGAVSAKGGQAPAGQRPEPPLHTEVQIESGGTAQEPEPELDAAQQQSQASQNPATAGIPAQEGGEPADVDDALAESVDNILSALDEPEVVSLPEQPESTDAGGVSAKGGQAPAGQRPEPPLHTQVQIESGGTAQEPKPELDAAQQQSQASQNPATAGIPAQEGGEPADVDDALAESVDHIPSALDEPEVVSLPEQPETEESSARSLNRNELENLLQEVPLSADEPTAETTADEVEDLLKEPAPASEAPEEPPQTEPPAAAPAEKHRSRTVGALWGRLSDCQLISSPQRLLHIMSPTRIIIFINSFALIVLIVGQFSFQHNAKLLNQELGRNVSQTVKQADEMLKRLDAKITLPDGTRTLSSPREYIKLLKAADTAFDKGNAPSAGTLYKEIIERFPTQDSNDHVSYRLGECYLSSAQPRWQAARMQFMMVIEKFPQSQYVALSHLRLAHCEGQLGAYASARRTLLELLANQSLYSRAAAAIFSEARYRLAQYYDTEAHVLRACQRQAGAHPPETGEGSTSVGQTFSLPVDQQPGKAAPRTMPMETN